MYTASWVQETVQAMKDGNAPKANVIRATAKLCLGWPYVWASQGEMCTPKWRRNRIPYCLQQKYADMIRDNCPVLSDNAASCDGCKWDGVRCFDCRGFTRWLLAQAGVPLYGESVTTQWETASNWAARGTIDNLPRGLVCCVFRPGHTGMYQGNGNIIHCSGTVKEEALPGKPKWERWAIPAGLYTNAELEAAGVKFDPAKNIPTLRRGSNCDEVEELQVLLNAKYGANLEIDGSFGAKTEAAVKAFQQTHGLTADGICGPKTRAALGLNATKNSISNPESVSKDSENETSRTFDARNIWNSLYRAIGNPFGVAGLMGNLYAESSLIPNNLQGSGNKALGMTDAEYTDAVDSGAYTAESFATDGFGYGLAQWTYNTRKARLLNYANAEKKSIGDPEMQVQFLLQEIKGYSNVWPILLKAKTVREASDAVLIHYEKPANQSEENQARRAALGQRYFDRFASATSSDDYVSISRLKAMELKALLVPLIQTAQKVLNEVETALNGGEEN